MLVVVENGNAHALAKAALHLEAFRRLDVLQIDCPEGRLHGSDNLDQLVRIGLVKFDIEGIDVGELLEENGLSFHDGLRAERTDRAQAEHRRAVGHDPDQIAARGQAGRLLWIVGDRHRRRGDAWRVSQRQVPLRRKRLGGDHAQLARHRRAMIIEGVLAKLISHGAHHLKGLC